MILQEHADEMLLHSRLDPHRPASSLAEVILGGQDGLVNVLGVILGLAAATYDPRIVITAGLAATFAESISMGAVAYTSTLAEADLYESELRREYRHIQRFPKLERAEIHSIFQRKGFEGSLLEQIVDTVTADKDVWVSIMMAEEHQLSPTDRKEAFRSALLVGFSAVFGSLIPIIPFIFFPIAVSIWMSIALTALVLFGVGVYKANVTIGKPWRSGLEMAVIGTISALCGYLIGIWLKVPGV